MSPEPSQARVCQLTAEARGALGVVRIWGSRALEIADKAFRPAGGIGLAQARRDRPRFGRVGQGRGDEVVAVVIGDEVEFHCHGGPQPMALVLNALIDLGAKQCSPESWLKHSTGNRITGEALADLAKAPTLRSAEILLEQAQGALQRELMEIVRLARSDTSYASRWLQTLMSRSEIGTRLISGWTVAIAGRPNVGKSRLFNALAGYDRAIVDPTPGTTRDVVTIRTAFEGWPVELVDTAGLRESDDPIEAAGIARATARQASADLTLLVLDASEPLSANDHVLIDRLDGALIVANKADLPAVWTPWNDSVIAVSAETGEGLDRLPSAIAGRLLPEIPPANRGVPFRESHRHIIRAALGALKDVGGGEWIAILEASFGLSSTAVDSGFFPDRNPRS